MQIAGRTALLFWNSRFQQSQADASPHVLCPERGAGAPPMLASEGATGKGEELGWLLGKEKGHDGCRKCGVRQEPQH